MAELVDAWDLKSHGILIPCRFESDPRHSKNSVSLKLVERYFYVTMSQRYPIPAKTICTEISIKRSRFIATIGYTDTVDAARNFIQGIRDEMPDATHHVYAFRVGYGSRVIEGLSDDGEPPGTSGKPVMSVIRGADLGDVVIVVTRYFGGTKLGTGGLVRAYSRTAKEALKILPVCEKITTVTLEVTIPYHSYKPFKRLLAEHEAHIIDETFAGNVTVQFTVPEEHLEMLSKRAGEYTVGKVEPKVLGL